MLGVEMTIEDDRLSSTFSIDENMDCTTKKSLPPRSLRLLESGPALYIKKDTIGNFLNL